MKQKIILLFSIMLIIMCVSCQKEKKEEDLIKPQEIVDSITIESNTSVNITLPDEIESFPITWVSEDPSIISNTGIISKKKDNQTTNLIATITYQNKTYSKSFVIVVNKYTPEEYLNLMIPSFSFDTNIESEFSLESDYSGISVTWKSNNQSILTNTGIIFKTNMTQNVSIIVTFSYEGFSIDKEFAMSVSAYSDNDIIEQAYSKISIPNKTNKNIELPTLIDGVTLLWSSSRKKVLTDNGEVIRGLSDTNTTLYLTLSYNSTSIYKEFLVIVEGFSTTEKLQMAIEEITFDENLKTNLTLGETYAYNTLASWNSSNPSILSNKGIYTYNDSVKTIDLTLTLSLEGESMQKIFHFNLLEKEEAVKDHMVVNRINAFNPDKFNDLEIKDDRLVLKENALIGTYESDPITTMKFSSLVGSWASISSTTSTVELLIKCQVNGVWSDFISYKPWGLGLKNAGVNQSNSLIKLSIDELMVNNGMANGIIYKVILRRNAAGDESPKLSLVAFALQNTSYQYNVDISSYPTEKLYDVPRLCQRVVPVIGGSICSATSTTMLLKYKGLSFIDKDQYEHRYIAGIVNDYGNDIYGNWVYNTVTMGGYGFDAYVGRFYSVNELVEHLAKIGPVALSVKGTMVSTEKTYTTNGHLIVAIGYKYINNQLYILCNDPNVDNVYCEYSKTIIENTWRGVVYVIE